MAQLRNSSICPLYNSFSWLENFFKFFFVQKFHKSTLIAGWNTDKEFIITPKHWKPESLNFKGETDLRAWDVEGKFTLQWNVQEKRAFALLYCKAKKMFPLKKCSIIIGRIFSLFLVSFVWISLADIMCENILAWLQYWVWSRQRKQQGYVVITATNDSNISI